MKKIAVFIPIAILLFTLYLYSSNKKSRTNFTENIDSTQNTNALPTGNVSKDTTLQKFPEMGVSLVVPNDLDVVRTPNYNSEDQDKLDSYVFYIQDYKGSGATDFQIYGLYQVDIPTISWEQFEQIEGEKETYKYVMPIEVNGIKGFETQLNGERNNYVYLFHLKDRVLRIAVSPATDIYKESADRIISTLQVYSDN